MIIAKENAIHSSDSASQRPLKILVMDDEEMIRNLASRMLNILGFAPTACVCGEDAVALYKSAMTSGAPFFAAIMDLKIPFGMGGKDAAKEILDFDLDARLIVSSGYFDDPVMANPASYGFRGVLPKPYTARDMCMVLAELIFVKDDRKLPVGR